MVSKSLDTNKLRLRQYPDPILRSPALPVEIFTPEVSAIAEKMTEIMLANNGIGLAGPQVGISRRIVVISLSGKREDVEVLINPVLSNFQGISEMEEGCLSLPGIRATVRRSAACTVKALDINGQEFVLDAVDLAAIVVQHETDHLNGRLFIDRLNSLSRLSCRRALKQMEQEFQEKN
ncbi:MAG: peptide deformylase [Sedimentisphaerales bacterium]|nr:peptide deformylase [Sedimentisphaerales bacterium]